MCDLRLSGAIASRAKIGSWITFTVAWTTLVHFPLAHMVWGGTVVHISAGTAAFVLAVSARGLPPFELAPAQPAPVPRPPPTAGTRRRARRKKQETDHGSSQAFHA